MMRDPKIGRKTYGNRGKREKIIDRRSKTWEKCGVAELFFFETVLVDEESWLQKRS